MNVLAALRIGITAFQQPLSSRWELPRHTPSPPGTTAHTLPCLLDFHCISQPVYEVGLPTVHFPKVSSFQKMALAGPPGHLEYEQENLHHEVRDH